MKHRNLESKDPRGLVVAGLAAARRGVVAVGVLVLAAAALALAGGVTQARAVVVGAAPAWPIPADSPAGPPRVPALPAAGDAAPPADQVADPVTPAASCGGWFRQSYYGDRWPAASRWWEYRCSSESDSSYDNCAGGGACNASCDYCFVETERRTDYFYWNGSDAVFYGEDYYHYLYYWGNLFGEGGGEVSAWWDAAPPAKWYDLEPVALTVSKQGTGSGSVDSSPAGISCGASCQASFNPGAVVTLTATADASSIFTGWSGDCSGSGSCQVTIDQARAVTATFARTTVDLTVSKAGTGAGSVTSSPAGISCGASCQASFNPGAVVTLTATADASSIFTGWSGDCSGSGSCQVTMDQARAVTATFKANAPPSASFTVTCTGLTCSFDGSASADSDGTVASQSWAFGDGALGSGVTPTHTYEHAGTYAASLTVTDNGGASATASMSLAVTNLAPSAAFTVTCSSLQCTFDASGSADKDGRIVAYTWSFGDGTSGTVTTKSTAHDYPKAGNYTVTLTVADNDSGSASASQRVNPISLSARGSKQGGQQKVDLSWNGATGTTYDVYRNGAKIVTVATATYTDTAAKGTGTYKYKVCDPASATCSNEATVSF